MSQAIASTAPPQRVDERLRPVFCAGAELGAVVHPDGADQETQFGYVRGYGKVIQRLRELDLPIIAAVNGAAVSRSRRVSWCRKS